jgi:MerR family copper efflux transcriptional regulator
MRAHSRTTQAQANERPSLLKIGEVSKLSGIGIEALRFYEKSGLLNHPARTGSGYRLYDSSVLERLAFIKRAQFLGFSLEEIKHVIAESRAGQSPCAGVREIVRQRLKELDERMAQMRRYRKELAGALEEWDQVGERKGHICGLIEGTRVEQTPPATRGIGQRQLGKRKRRHGHEG